MNRGGTVKDKDIHIGDIVRVRQWDDMANEFRCILDFSIEITKKRTRFTNHMKKYCGKVFTVSEAYMSNGISIGYKFNDEDNSGINNWFICAEMLEPFENDIEWEVADDEDMKLLFG